MFRLVGCRDVWDDIKVPHPRSFERIGYPTQKPEPLLERVIEASSNEGGIVADFFCGGGTTPAVAQSLNRRWVACDQSRIAVAITADRVAKVVREKGGVHFSQSRYAHRRLFRAGRPGRRADGGTGDRGQVDEIVDNLHFFEYNKSNPPE